jgi:hypothetical protein
MVGDACVPGGDDTRPGLPLLNQSASNTMGSGRGFAVRPTPNRARVMLFRAL